MNVYEYDKSLVESLEPLSKEMVKSIFENTINPILQAWKFENNYIMLLSHEERYISIFNSHNKDTNVLSKEIQEFLFRDLALTDMFNYKGQIKVIKPDGIGEGIHIWIDNVLFVLFKCDNLFV